MHAASLSLDRLPRLGIDIGRVIIGAVDDSGRADTSFLSGTLERAMETPPTPPGAPGKPGAPAAVKR